MDIVFFVQKDDVELLKAKNYVFSCIKSNALDGLTNEIAIILSAAALTFRSIAPIVKILIERHSKISLSIEGNEYRNIDKDTALRIIHEHFNRTIPRGNEDGDSTIEKKKIS